MANLSTLVTPTCFRTADGEFHGFEGCQRSERLLLRQLHARLELRDRHAASSSRRWRARCARPLSATRTDDAGRACTSGRCCRTATDRSATPPPTGRWARSSRRIWTGSSRATRNGCASHWPQVKRALEFSWIPGGWDADRDGVMEGVQHNTYDVEFYGPNPLCGIYYLGALARGGRDGARSWAIPPLRQSTAACFDNGSKWIDANLFNGEYYIQKVRGIPKDKIAPTPVAATWGRTVPEAPEFQLGDGCLAIN